MQYLWLTLSIAAFLFGVLNVYALVRVGSENMARIIVNIVYTAVAIAGAVYFFNLFLEVNK